MTCTTDRDVITHYTGESKVYHHDLGPALGSRTITSITSMTTDDSALTISSQAVLTSNTDDFDKCGNAVTIEANTGIRYTLTGGTAATDQRVEFTARIVVKFVTSAGTEQGVIWVKVLDPLTEE